MYKRLESPHFDSLPRTIAVVRQSGFTRPPPFFIGSMAASAAAMASGPRILHRLRDHAKLAASLQLALDIFWAAALPTSPHRLLAELTRALEPFQFHCLSDVWQAMDVRLPQIMSNTTRSEP